MTSMFLLFSHSLTDEQIDDAKNTLGVDEFVSLPDSIQQAWSSVPPELDGVGGYAEAFYEFLSHRAKKGDFVLISGDFGLCYLLVQWCKVHDFIPVYATTKRDTEEIETSKGIERKSTFKHVRFRRY